MNMTGIELSELLSRSPEECHRVLMQEYGKYVYSIVYNKLRSYGTQEDIEECFCDVFADIFIKFEYDEKYVNDIKSYIGTVAKRTAIDRYRKLSAEREHTSYTDEDEMTELVSDFSVDEQVDSSELRRILLKSIKELGEPDSTILIQKFYYNRKSSEIAKTVSMTASSVRSRCTRAIDKLRGKLAEAGITM
jgi:RNA polymerase sigma-70 factor (ECF subfamily)